MSTDLSQILVFRTNISSEQDKHHVLKMLGAHEHVSDCSIDTEDVDRVLRVVSPVMRPHQIIEILEKNGFDCRELD